MNFTVDPWTESDYNQKTWPSVCVVTSERTVETQQVLFLLQAAGHLHDGDGETVGGSSEHRRGQRHIILVQEVCSGGIREVRFNTFGPHCAL